MSATNSSIFIEVVIDYRELFLINLSLVKRRLLLALGLITALFASVIWFFNVIGERMILLETSPFFIGLPVLAWFAQVVRIRAACKQYLSGLPESQRSTQYMFQRDADGYDLASGNSFSHVAWSDLLKAVEKPAYFLLYRNAFEIRILPKRAFHDAAEIEEFKEILAMRLGSRANLLAR